MDYERAQTASIKKAINQFDWKAELGLLSNPNLQVKLLNDVLINIFTNFIPNDEKVIKPRDPPWITKSISHSYRKYLKAYKSFIKKGSPAELRENIEFLKSEHSEMVSDTQNTYLASQGDKLSKSGPNIKQIWTIINTTFLKKKILLFLPFCLTMHL